MTLSKGMLSDLQRLGIKFGHGLNHLVPGCRCAQIFQHDIFPPRLGQAMMFFGILLHLCCEKKNMSNHVASRTRLINRFSVAKQNVSGLQFYFKQVKSNEIKCKANPICTQNGCLTSPLASMSESF